MAFVDRVTEAVPALLRLAAENEYGDRGDVLVHGFLGDVAFRELDNYRSGGPVAMEEVRTVVALLETELGVDRGVDEAIAVSFVENLPYPDQPGADLVDLLGPEAAGGAGAAAAGPVVGGRASCASGFLDACPVVRLT